MVKVLKRVSNVSRRRVGVTPEVSDEAKPSSRKQPPVKNKAAVALGKLGGRKGGLARARSLTADQRTAIAKKAAKARWKKERKKSAPER